MKLKQTLAAMVVTAFTGAVFAVPVTVSNTTAQTIPDLSSITSTINVATGGTIGAGTLSFSIAASHTWVGDLIYTITHGSTSVVLMDRPGVPATNFGNSSNLSNASPLIFVGSASSAAESIGQGCTNTVGLSAGCLNATFQSHQLLSAFDGMDGFGDWILTISDNSSEDLGNLASWSVTYDTNSVPEPTSLALIGLGLAGLAATRRRKPL